MVTQCEVPFVVKIKTNSYRLARANGMSLYGRLAERLKIHSRAMRKAKGGSMESLEPT